MKSNLFTKIYEKYYNDVFRIVFHYTLNRFDSEDIVQFTFIKLYKNISKFHEPNEDVKKWLFRVAINHAKNHLISPWKSKSNLQEDLKLFGMEEKESTLFYDLKQIAKIYRITLYLYYFEGYNIKEIAKILNTTESNIKQRLKRGKEKLKMEIESGVK